MINKSNYINYFILNYYILYCRKYTYVKEYVTYLKKFINYFTLNKLNNYILYCRKYTYAKNM